MVRKLDDVKKEVIEELKKEGAFDDDKGKIDEEAVSRHSQRERNSALKKLAEQHRIIGKDK